jgi:manganese/zinc/iron transport system substrate-binding protein
MVVPMNTFVGSEAGRIRRWSLMTLAVMAAWIGGCDRPAPESAGPSTRPSDMRPIRAVATVAMVGDVVAGVGGDRVEVGVLMGSGVDPHLYKPTRDDVAKLAAADMVFYVGLHLEGKMAETLERLAGKPVVAVGDAVPKGQLLGDGGGADPHVWMDPALWASTIDAVVETLTTHDPDYAQSYRDAGESLRGEIASLTAYGKQIVATLPESSRLVITSHDAFAYMGRAFGLEVMGVQGLSTESEAGLKRINELVDILVERKVAAVFIESSVSPRNIQALIDGAASRGHRVTIGGELFSDAMGAAGTYEGTYVGMIDHNLTTIVRGLGGTAPERGMNGRLGHGR